MGEIKSTVLVDKNKLLKQFKEYNNYISDLEIKINNELLNNMGKYRLYYNLNEVCTSFYVIKKLSENLISSGYYIKTGIEVNKGRYIDIII